MQLLLIMVLFTFGDAPNISPHYYYHLNHHLKYYLIITLPLLNHLFSILTFQSLNSNQLIILLSLVVFLKISKKSNLTILPKILTFKLLSNSIIKSLSIKSTSLKIHQILIKFTMKKNLIVMKILFKIIIILIQNCLILIKKRSIKFTFLI